MVEIDFSPLVVFEYIVTVLRATTSQLLILLGPFLILAVLMHLASSVIQSALTSMFGYAFYLRTLGWLGTVVHELGHLLFAILFMHRIAGTRLTTFNPREPYVGYVATVYPSQQGAYFKIGHFFIGLGPIIVGTIVIYTAAKIFLGGNLVTLLGLILADSDMFTSVAGLQELARDLVELLKLIYTVLFTRENLTNWKFYVFIYVALAVGSSIRLSPPDIRGAFFGFLTIALMLLVFNFLTVWHSDFLETAMIELTSGLSRTYGVMIFVLLLNAIFAIALFIAWAVIGVATSWVKLMR